MIRILFVFAAALAAWAFAGFDAAAGSALLLGEVTPAAVNTPPPPPARWARREQMKSWNNVGASQTAYVLIPRYPRTVRGMTLELGGTTFTKALISRFEMFLGSKSIYGPVTGSDIARFGTYENGPLRDGDAKFLNIDFMMSSLKEIAHEQLGGIDMTVLPEGELRCEVDIGAATAPTLKGWMLWGNPEGSYDTGKLMKKLVKRTYPTAAAGDFYPDVDMRGAIVLKQEFSYGTIAAATATAGSGNTGDGAMGTITVSADTPCGTYYLEIVEPGANVGTFIVRDEFGRRIGKGVVASAFSAGGLAFTLADGATDFVAGDAFVIVVGASSMNLNAIEVKKNEEVWFSKSDLANRYEQKLRGRAPLAGRFMLDYLLDGHFDGRLHTAGAKSLDYKLGLTASDTVTLISEVLATPLQI